MSRAAADASVFHAIADPTRRAVLEMLREGDRTVTALLDGLKRVTQSALSQHLAVLRQVGLVVARKDGRKRVYSIRAQPLQQVNDWVGEFDKFWTHKLDELGRYLDQANPPKAARREQRGS
jgi:DNA-binding transcriptional ArsR family regulator